MDTLKHKHHENRQDILASYQVLIEKIQSIQEDRTHSGNSLKFEIDEFINSHWQVYHTEALLTGDFDFTPIVRLHQILIEHLNLVLKSEVSIVNQILLENQTDLNLILDQVEDEKLAYGIYLFSKQNHEREYVIIGDVHSDDLSVQKLLNSVDFYSKVSKKVPIKLIFMGDYVDRGKAHLKTLERIMLLKILFPDHVFLLRGNHDGGKFNKEGTLILPYRIPDEDCLTDYFPKYLEHLMLNNRGVDKTFITAYFDLFEALPYLAFIQTKQGIIQCVHGGIPKPYFGNEIINGAKPYDFIKSLSMLTRYTDLDNANATILENQMWSDPYTGNGEYKMAFKRFKFDADHFDAYASRFGVWKLLRGHEARTKGFEINHYGRVYTIFSSGDTDDSYYNSVNACYALVSTDGEIIIRHFL